MLVFIVVPGGGISLASNDKARICAIYGRVSIGWWSVQGAGMTYLLEVPLLEEYK